MKHSVAAFWQFPYTGAARLLFLQYVLLKLLPRASFPWMSLIPAVMRHYGLDSEEEFRVRYYVSRIGFDAIWASKDRSTEKAVESFYSEHDADLWRQAFLSRSRYLYKKKILLGYHVAKKIRAKNILDYGCGASATGNYLARKGFTVTGADIPSPTLEFVRQELPFKAALTITSHLRLEDSYDYIMCLDALEHTLAPLAITKKLMAALRPKGYLYINFPVEKDFSPDCSHPHTREAQAERPATFDYIRSICDELVPEILYKMR